MYERLKALLLPVLRVPAGAPEPPPGHGPGEFLRTFRAAPAYLSYRLLHWWVYAAFWAFGVAVLSVFVLTTLEWWGLLVVPVLVAFAAAKAAVLYVTTRLDYEMRWYILTERSLRLREGVWVVRELTLTFANVQNIHVLQGPVERLFGFSNILLETAGGGSGAKEKRLADPHRALLRGIDNPAEVRDLILRLLRRYRTAGLGDEGEQRVTEAAEGFPLPLLAEVRDEARALRAALTGSRE
jgi:membrane protein YdbS with pleckstrin-like domain